MGIRYMMNRASLLEMRAKGDGVVMRARENGDLAVWVVMHTELFTSLTAARIR